MYRKGQKPEYYTELAKKHNYPARSVYKLEEIDKKYHILKTGMAVLDLGSAPGSWLLYASGKVSPKGFVVGVDIEEVNILKKENISFLKKSVFDLKLSDFPKKFDAVISDMAPKTTGVTFVDAGKSLELSEQAFETAKMFLKHGGSFICKIFDSREAMEFFQEVKKHFEFVKRVKPKAVRRESKEFYIVAKKFKV